MWIGSCLVLCCMYAVRKWTQIFNKNRKVASQVCKTQKQHRMKVCLGPIMYVLKLLKMCCIFWFHNLFHFISFHLLTFRKSQHFYHSKTDGFGPFQLFDSLTQSSTSCFSFLFFNHSSFQYRWHTLKGPRNKKGGRHKRKCNLNSKHSSVMRQWVTAMGVQTLKATFKTPARRSDMWTSTC